MRRLKAALGMILLFALARCAIVTNLSTAGYGLIDAGADGSGGNGMCDAADGACIGLYVACTSSADCSDGGVCCLVADTFSSFSASCQAQPTCGGGLFSIQMCSSAAECAGCVKQTCTIDAVPITFSACGTIPGCTSP
jgi:hypothetical protein